LNSISALQKGSQKEKGQACEDHKFANLLLWALQQTCQMKETFETAGYLQQAVYGLETLNGALEELESFLLTLLLKDVQPKSYDAILRELANASMASQNQSQIRTKDDPKVPDNKNVQYPIQN
jgi:hypothetical protein